MYDNCVHCSVLRLCTVYFCVLLCAVFCVRSVSGVFSVSCAAYCFVCVFLFLYLYSLHVYMFVCVCAFCVHIVCIYICCWGVLCVLYSMQVHDCCAWYADICMCDCVCMCAYVCVVFGWGCRQPNPIPPIVVAYAGIG